MAAGVGTPPLVIRTIIGIARIAVYLPPAWGKRLALRILLFYANRGVAEAGRHIASLACTQSGGPAPRIAADAIAHLRHPKAVNAAWAIWHQTRDAGLRAALENLSVPATAPIELRLYSLLVTGKDHLGIQDPGLVPPLILAAFDGDALLAAKARQNLLSLKRKPAIDVLCLTWFTQRTKYLEEIILSAHYNASQPVVVSIFTALLRKTFTPILSMGAECIPPLLLALGDSNQDIAAGAGYCLHHLTNESAIDCLCAKWMENRSLQLAEIITSTRYLPAKPPGLRLLVGLKLGLVDLVRPVAHLAVGDVIHFAGDADSTVKDNCGKLLASASPELQEGCCRWFVETGTPSALQICLAHQFIPSTPELRAIYLLLSDQWDEYALFDFECNYARIFYATASETVRQSIAEKIRQSGRPDFLKILLGSAFRYTRDEADAGEIEALLRVLFSKKEVERVWGLLVDLPVVYAARIIAFLRQNNFQPAETPDRDLWDQLNALKLPESVTGIHDLPIGLPVARFHVPGRINEIAFHPTRPLLAIGTGNRKTVLWDFHHAQIHTVINGFRHSISQVAFDESGNLFLGERTSTRDICQIYRWEGGRLTVLGSHDGDITAIEPLGPDQALTAGKDSRLRLWVDSRMNATIDLSFWPRSVSLTPQKDLAVLNGKSLAFYDLPALHPSARKYRRPRGRGIRTGITTASALRANAEILLAGQFNGQTLVYPQASQKERRMSVPLLDFGHPVRALQFDPHKSIFLAASTAAQVKVYSWPALDLVSTLSSGKATRLTTFHLSTDSQILAVGESDTTCSLWDFRLDQVPRLVNQPVGALTLNDLTLAGTFLHSEDLPPDILALLKGLYLILQARFRNDILVEDTKTIQPGEYDIILESV